FRAALKAIFYIVKCPNHLVATKPSFDLGAAFKTALRAGCSASVRGDESKGFRQQRCAQIHLDSPIISPVGLSA
ncbi:hypothetical protein, partial [Xanthomonas arboricola]